MPSIFTGLRRGGIDLCGKITSEIESISISVSSAPRPPASPDPACAEAPATFTLRQPRPEDGPAITALIRACPSLDANSAYCHLIQCLHFAGTCVVAERGGELVGWVSAHRPPSAPEQIFVWQVAVHPSARETGLGSRMLDALVARPVAQGADVLAATITEANRASWALFEAFARKRGLALSRTPLFERATHFAGAHETEWQAAIGPLPRQSPISEKENT